MKCKHALCERSVEIGVDKSRVIKYCVKRKTVDSRVQETDYILHGGTTAPKTGFCYYHNRFITANVGK